MKKYVESGCLGILPSIGQFGSSVNQMSRDSWAAGWAFLIQIFIYHPSAASVKFIFDADRCFGPIQSCKHKDSLIICDINNVAIEMGDEFNEAVMSWGIKRNSRDIVGLLALREIWFLSYLDMNNLGEISFGKNIVDVMMKEKWYETSIVNSIKAEAEYRCLRYAYGLNIDIMSSGIKAL